MQPTGGGPDTRRRYGARTYWNPITRRVGVFGGYGMFAVRNDRCEFDAAAGGWLELEPDRRDTDLWPRQAPILVPDATGKRIFLVGGVGNPTGKQGDIVRGLPAFNSQFHILDDVWELDPSFSLFSLEWAEGLCYELFTGSGFQNRMRSSQAAVRRPVIVAPPLRKRF